MAAISNTDIYQAPHAELSESVPDIETGLFSANGRMGVLKYMAQSLILLLATAAIFGVLAFVSGVTFDESTSAPQFSPLLLAVIVVALVPLIWISTVMLIKRLHDINLGGWLLALTLIPIIGGLIALFFICIPGNKEGNKFGPAEATASWEKVLGIITLALLALSMIGLIVSLITGLR